MRVTDERLPNLLPVLAAELTPSTPGSGGDGGDRSSSDRGDALRGAPIESTNTGMGSAAGDAPSTSISGRSPAAEQQQPMWAEQDWVCMYCGALPVAKDDTTTRK